MNLTFKIFVCLLVFPSLKAEPTSSLQVTNDGGLHTSSNSSHHMQTTTNESPIKSTILEIDRNITSVQALDNSNPFIELRSYVQPCSL